MKATDLFVKCLENEGVEYIFGLPGEENEDLMISLSESKIKFITVRHEQGAAFMADVYGRLTQKVGVCLSTLGPGATNLITGVADANMDSAPLVAITGQGDLIKHHKEAHQYIDISDVFRPITKWTTKIVDTEIIPEVVRKAFKVAQMERPGATHIEFPEDIARKQSNAMPLPVTPTAKYIPHESDILMASKLIKSAKCPMILAGNGVIRTNASKELAEFVEKNRIYTANTFMSKGVLPDNHELSLFTVGMQAKDYVMCAFEKADLVICIGYEIVEYAPSFWNREKNKRIIHISTEPCEVEEHYSVDIELVGDIKSTLERLTALSEFDKDCAFYRKLRNRIISEFEEHRTNTDFPMKPQKVLLDLRTAMQKEDILISDVGAHKIWISRMFKAYMPNTVIISNGFASMGIALPGAISAKIAKPKCKVVAVTGDGGFLMNAQEIETAKRIGLSFVIVIFTDCRYGLTEWKQVIHLKKQFGQRFTNPDFTKFAESFGAVGFKINKAEELLPTLKKALDINNVVIIDVPIDFEENFRLSEKLGNNVCETLE